MHVPHHLIPSSVCAYTTVSSTDPCRALLLLPLDELCRLTEQTLDSCQLKRTRGALVKVDLRWLCNHLTKWGLLGREFSLQDIALIAAFAKQRSTDPEAFVLHPQPLEYDYNEFEKLLLGIAWHIYLARGKKAAAPGGQVGQHNTRWLLPGLSCAAASRAVETTHRSSASQPFHATCQNTDGAQEAAWPHLEHRVGLGACPLRPCK